MILQSLVRLARNERLIADPDFEFKSVAWIVRLKEDGTVVAVEDNRLNLNEGKTDKRGKPIKPKWVGKDELIPLFPTGRSGTKPRAAFLVDMAKFVFGREPAGDAAKGLLVAYVERFRELVASCAVATGDPSASAVLSLLERVTAGREVAALPEDVSPSDLFMFRVGSDDGPVHARPAVRAYWKRVRASAVTSGADSMATTCLVTGEPIAGKPVLFPLIKGVPGAGTMGSGLLPFNGPSSRTWSSYGFEGNENAPVSRLAAEAAAMALNRLADPRPTNGTGEHLPVRRIRLSDDTITVFWSPEPEPDVQSVLDLIPNLIDPQDEAADVANLIASYRTSSFRPLVRPANFYAMTLTGTTGRIIVKDWIESSVTEIQTHIHEYFGDLQIARPVRTDDRLILENMRPPSLREIKVAAYRDLDDVPAPFGREWLRVVLLGRHARVPPGVVARVLSRIRTVFSKGDVPPPQAYAVLRLYLARGKEKDSHMKAFLNEDHPNPAYHCGRLLAVLDFAQQRALGNTNTTNVRRMLGAIMTAPALYLARVRKLTETAYLPKCPGNWPAYLKSRIQAIGSSMRDDYPRLLTLGDQSTFFLGLDQERSYLDTHPAEKYRVQATDGTWVQSVGEANIVKALTKLGHPFEYEPGIKLLGNAYRVPDFMIGAPVDSGRVFIEYLGMRDVPGYEERWQKKLAEFKEFGLAPFSEGGGRAGKLIAIDHDGRDYVGILSTLERCLGSAKAEKPDEPEGE